MTKLPSASEFTRFAHEAESSEWRDGFAAYGLQIGLDMGKGQDWAMGWLTARLLDSNPGAFNRRAR